MEQVTVRYSANASVNPSTPWPFLFAFASSELDSVGGDVFVETATPQLVCQEQIIAPKATAVDLAVECKALQPDEPEPERSRHGLKALKADDEEARAEEAVALATLLVPLPHVRQHAL